MKAKTFAIITAIISVFYSLGCFFIFNQPFWGFTTIFIGAVITLYPLYFERQRIEAMTDAQIAQYFQSSLKNSQNSIYRTKLSDINDELNDIRSGILKLTAEELGEFAEQRIFEITKQPGTHTYWATHIIDSDLTLKIWNEDYSSYPWIKSYIDKQKTILDMDGKVTRIFFFEKKLLKQRINNCKDTINNHKTLFNGTKTSVTTLTAIIRNDSELLESDFSILDNKEVFIWKRVQGSEYGTFFGGQYISNEKQVEIYKNKWERIRKNAMKPEELFELIEKNVRVFEF